MAAIGGGQGQQQPLPPGLEPPDDWKICAITVSVLWAVAARALYLHHDQVRALLSGQCQRSLVLPPLPSHTLA
eukprot:COSAG01_NODE_8268_length_2849_cov_3.472364_3_plen_73_part_00